MFLMSAFMKFKGGPEMAQGMAHLGVPDSMVLPLAILELACLIVYLIPATSVLGPSSSRATWAAPSAPIGAWATCSSYPWSWGSWSGSPCTFGRDD